MRCIPCGGSIQPEIAHLNDCYPPPKALLSSAPEYRPLAQDLSKLTYFATNKPSKLAHIGDALEKRVGREAKKSSSGYQKSRASLLISLAILKALLTECKRDIGLFGRYALKIIDTSLSVKIYQAGGAAGAGAGAGGGGGVDLEVVARAAASFVAYTTYTDGAGIGVDDSLTRTYHSVLRKLDGLATWADEREKPDMEQQSRTRLIALAALNGAATSDAMFSSNAQFPKQVEMILPPLLYNIFASDQGEDGSGETMEQLKLETAKIEMDASPSPFFSEFSARRPINDRRAPSLHAHVTGEKGPSNKDVLSASVRSLQAMVAQCKTGQITHIIDATTSFLDKGRWSDVERCCWLAERLTAWISLQYRFVIPTRLVEVLVDYRDTPIHPKHTSIIAMVSAILTSTTSLIGLGVTDLLNNLVTLIIRRLRISYVDALLPPLVRCVASLGTHIYYADQINDIVEEISIRIAELQTSDARRDEIIRVLVHCIMGVMQVAQNADEHAASRQAFGVGVAANATSLPNMEANEDGSPLAPPDKGKAPHYGTPLNTPRHHTSRRNPISPEVWQETLPLLCEGDYGVRSAYARALLCFLETEMPRLGIPQPQTSASRPKLTSQDVAHYRFCNALHAAIYTLVMSSCLGAGSAESAELAEASPQVSQGPQVNENGVIVPSSATATESNAANEPSSTAASATGTASGREKEKGVSFNITEPSPSSTPPLNAANGSTTPSRQRRGSRRVSLPLNRVHSNYTLPSFSNVATPYDFAAAVSILDQLHTIIPAPALMTGAPMLLALDKDAGVELIRRPGDGRQGAWVLERKRAIRETVALVWRRIGERWGISDVEDLADTVLLALPEPYLVPPLHAWPADLPLLPGAEEPVSFPPHHLEGESSTTARPLMDPEVVLSAIANSHRVQGSIGRDASALMRRLGSKWSVEVAVRDSVERFSSANVRPADDPHYDVASALMSMNNGSYTSFGGRQQQGKSIDVEDLREALGGRTDLNTSAAESMISSAADDHSHSIRAPGTGTGSGPGQLGLPPLNRLQSNGSINGVGAVGVNAGKRRTQPDVKDVLKDIFKDKKKGKKFDAGASASAFASAPSPLHSSSNAAAAAAAAGAGESNVAEGQDGMVGPSANADGKKDGDEIDEKVPTVNGANDTHTGTDAERETSGGVVAGAASTAGSSSTNSGAPYEVNGISLGKPVAA